MSARKRKKKAGARPSPQPSPQPNARGADDRPDLLNAGIKVKHLLGAVVAVLGAGFTLYRLEASADANLLDRHEKSNRASIEAQGVLWDTKLDALAKLWDSKLETARATLDSKYDPILKTLQGQGERNSRIELNYLLVDARLQVLSAEAKYHAAEREFKRRCVFMGNGKVTLWSFPSRKNTTEPTIYQMKSAGVGSDVGKRTRDSVRDQLSDAVNTLVEARQKLALIDQAAAAYRDHVPESYRDLFDRSVKSLEERVKTNITAAKASITKLNGLKFG